MVIKLIRVGVSAGIGAGDIVCEYVDADKGYTKAFQNISDWYRTGAVVGGYVANSMRLVDDDVSEPLVLAGIPLLEKSIYGAVQEYVLKGKGRGRMGLRLKRKGSPRGNIRWG